MRGWWKAALVQDLITRFEAMPNRGPEDSASLELLRSHLKGGTSERKGTLQNYISRLQTESNPSYYGLVLHYLQHCWAPKYTVIPDVSIPQADNDISFSGDVESFSHVWVRKERYGAGQEHRGQSARYAYMDGRIPVDIERIFRVQHKVSESLKLVAMFAIVRRLCPCDARIDFPWDLRATDIGVGTWKANSFGTQEVVSLDRFTGHSVIAPIGTVQGEDIWVTIAWDHDGTEVDPDYLVEFG
ncbi:hypothetical protein C8R45DRAFT_908494 [Mycena sanguinolenta]|nr:hypothetical protein C8R45DRAFT_908494 [Mycena sanguinolenta]